MKFDYKKAVICPAAARVRTILRREQRIFRLIYDKLFNDSAWTISGNRTEVCITPAPPLPKSLYLQAFSLLGSFS